jgi:hypothetical protein
MSLTQADVATAVGYAIGAGSTALYTPMIFRCVKRGSAAGLSPETWLLKLCGYVTSDIYNLSRHYPLSQYAESLTLAVQALVMLILVCRYQRKVGPAVAGLLVLVVSAVLLATPAGQERGIPALQAVATVAGASAVVPQIVLNMRRSGSGEFSPITASLLTGGNAVRAWTTQQLADGDAILLFGCALGFLVNATLLSQILYYALVREGMSIRSLYSSDFSPTRMARAASDGDLEVSARADSRAAQTTATVDTARSDWPHED